MAAGPVLGSTANIIGLQNTPSAINAPQRANTANSTGLADPLSTRGRVVDDNKYYIAELYQVTTGYSFRAFVPETFTLAIQNHWEPLFGSDGGGSVVAKGAVALGYPINLKYLTRRIWTGTEPLNFTFTFLLDAYADTKRDVQKPIENLLKMSTPVRSGIFLKSPGPTLFSDENRIYLRIGKFMVLDSVVIDNVDITFHTIASRIDGYYMSADINVTISTSYTPDQQDILNYFAYGQSGSNSLDPANRALTGEQLAEKLKDFANTTDGEAATTALNALKSAGNATGIIKGFNDFVNPFFPR